MSSGNKLLLVDSDTRTLRVLEVSLRRAGFDVDTAESASAALDNARARVPDLVITDTQLPDGDGFELCRRLRSETSLGQTGVFFLSEAASPMTKIDAINVGADDFLTKPVLVKEIISRVHAWLEARKGSTISRRERPGNLSGTLANLGVVDLLQVMETGKKSGIVHISSDVVKSGGFARPDEDRGTLYFRDGEVVDARLGKLEGQEAIFRMFLWDDGVFEIEFKSIDREDAIGSTTQSVLLEGMRRVDEWSRFQKLVPAVSSKLTVDYSALGRLYPEVPKRMRSVLHLFDGRRSLFEVVTEVSGDDADALDVIADLWQQDVLLTAEEEEAKDEGDVEAWLSSRPSPAAIPSALAQAVIPSPRTPSEILSAASPHDILGEQTVVNQQAYQGGTALPEPIGEPSLVLSRHTVPANRAVPLTRPTQSVIAPIPLRTASAVRAAPPMLASEQSDTESSWEPIRTRPPEGLPATPAPRALSSADSHAPEPAPDPDIAPAALPPWPVAEPPKAAPDLSEEDTASTRPPNFHDVRTPVSRPGRSNGALRDAQSSPPPARSFEKVKSDVWYDHKEDEDDDLFERDKDAWKQQLVGWSAIAAAALVIGVLIWMQTTAKHKQEEREKEKSTKVAKTPPVKQAAWPKTDPNAVKIEGAAPTAANPAAANPAAANPAAANPAVVDPATTKAASADPKAAAVTPAPSKAPAPTAAAPEKAAPAVLKKPPLTAKPTRTAPVAKPASPKPAADPAKADALVARAEKSLSSGSLKSAQYQFRSAISADASNANAHSGLAMAYVELGKDRSAKAEAWRALKIDRGQARAVLVLALIATNEGKTDDAKKQYQRYLRLAPKGKHADEVRRVLKSL